MERNEKMLRFSQKLRKNMTKEERLLWYDFLKTYPVQFRRQYVIGSYITDFYCYRAKLVIELDGSQHCEPSDIQYDQMRTAYLQAQGLLVLRYSNLDIMKNFRGVCENIDIFVKNRIRESL